MTTYVARMEYDGLPVDWVDTFTPTLTLPLTLPSPLRGEGEEGGGEGKRVEEGFWNAERQKLLELLFPLLTGAALAGAEEALEELLEMGMGVDWGLVNTRAVEWARRFAALLAADITETTRAFVGEAIAQWMESGERLEVLIEVLEPMFGRVRAEMIGVTETTRSWAEGNLATWRESGVVKGKRWETANDELVCPICEPLNGMVVGLDENGFTTEEGGMGLTAPPAHVRCRCGLAPVVEKR